MQGKSWCCTLNNFTDDEHSRIKADAASRAVCKYSVVGVEKGESGTPHLQMYFVFDKNMRLASVRKFIPRGHWELARGSAAQNLAYCSKECNFDSWGVLPNDPGRSGGAANKERWLATKRLAIAGDLDAVDPELYVRYFGTLQRIATQHVKKPADLESACGLWLWGEAGTGKSHQARAIAGGVAYFKRVNKWWDGYQEEEVVVLDDVDKTHAFIAYDLKIWADKYAFLAEVKGGTKYIRPKQIIVTSQFEPESIWTDTETLAAINRRFVKQEWKVENRC